MNDAWLHLVTQNVAVGSDGDAVLEKRRQIAWTEPHLISQLSQADVTGSIPLPGVLCVGDDTSGT
jgi:hypothetical protein